MQAFRSHLSSAESSQTDLNPVLESQVLSRRKSKTFVFHSVFVLLNRCSSLSCFEPPFQCFIPQDLYDPHQSRVFAFSEGDTNLTLSLC